MISIDVNSLNDRELIADAIAKLTNVLTALEAAEDRRKMVRRLIGQPDTAEHLRDAWTKFSRTTIPSKTTIKTRPLRGAFDLVAYADRMFAESGRSSIGLSPYQEKIVTRLDELTPEDLDEMNAGPAAWPKLAPFMDPQEAIQDDGIVCLIDGKKRKFLSRYVQQVHGTEWHDYLDRYDLPADYPQTCKDLIEQRRKAAIDRGFGKHDRDQEVEQQVQVTVPIRKTFGRRGTSQQVSVNIDFNGSTFSATTDRQGANELERSLARRLREFL